MAFVKQWWQLAICRVLLGLLESEFPPRMDRFDLPLTFVLQVASSLDVSTWYLAGILAMRPTREWLSSTLLPWLFPVSPTSSDMACLPSMGNTV